MLWRRSFPAPLLPATVLWSLPALLETRPSIRAVQRCFVRSNSISEFLHRTHRVSKQSPGQCALRCMHKARNTHNTPGLWERTPRYKKMNESKLPPIQTSTCKCTKAAVWPPNIISKPSAGNSAAGPGSVTTSSRGPRTPRLAAPCAPSTSDRTTTKAEALHSEKRRTALRVTFEICLSAKAAWQ